MAEIRFECPDCGHPVTADEDRAEALGTADAWICPECGFEIQPRPGAGIDIM